MSHITNRVIQTFKDSPNKSCEILQILRSKFNKVQTLDYKYPTSILIFTQSTTKTQFRLGGVLRLKPNQHTSMELRTTKIETIESIKTNLDS